MRDPSSSHGAPLGDLIAYLSTNCPTIQFSSRGCNFIVDWFYPVTDT